ncbi:MAG: translation elongation factor Ts [Candidatus Paceibacteria bacterium]
MASAKDVKKLRDATGVSVMQCKKALEEAGGDLERALEILKEKGSAVAAKKADRDLGAGTVAAYVHATKEIGAMVVLRSETDFVAKNNEFTALAYDIAMQVAATAPADVEALLAEPFIKDQERAVKDLVDAATQKFGERIEVAEFTRYTTQ